MAAFAAQGYYCILTYLIHTIKYTATQHQPPKHARPMLNKNPFIARSGLPGIVPLKITSGSCRNKDSAIPHRIHSSASNFLLMMASKGAEAVW
eukprot:scaffold86720_cov37-Tisochrysis_lutea.AAC.2